MKTLPIASEGWNREEQLRKNKSAIALLKKRIERNQKMSEEESNQREEFLADFKKIIDEQRLPGQKLYSQE